MNGPGASYRLVALLVAALAIRLIFFGGLLGWDDVEYWEGARALRAGTYAPMSTFQLRYTVTAPLAIAQAWLGEREWALALVPLMYSAAHLVLAGGLGWLCGGASVATTAVALLGIVPLDVIAATELHSDLPLAVFLAATVYAVLRGERVTRARGRWFVPAGVALGLAAATKEVALALLVVLILRLWLVKRWAGVAHYGWLVAGFLGVVVAETAWLAVVTGDPLYRYRGPIAGFHAATVLSAAPGYAWMASYPNMLLNPLSGSFGYFAGVFYLVVASTVWALRRSERALVPLGIWWGTLLLLLNFAPLDATFTRPLFHHFARTLHPLLIPFVLAAGLWLVHGLGGRRLVRTCVVGVVAVLAVLGILTTHADYRAWAAIARRAAPFIETLPPDVRVVTDPLTAAQLRVLLPAWRERIMSYSSGPLAEAGGSVLVLADPFHLALARQRGETPPGAMVSPPASWERVMQFDRRPRMSLRGTLKRWLGRGAGPAPEAPSVTLWRVRP
jgi:4-amino-4-deoxy-L-arabinose transferase-like glycosyltransferase